MPRSKGGLSPASAASASSRALARMAMASAPAGDDRAAGNDALVCVCMRGERRETTNASVVHAVARILTRVKRRHWS